MIVQPDFLYALYILINGRLEASGIESVLVCFPSLPPQLVLSDQDFPGVEDLDRIFVF